MWLVFLRKIHEFCNRRNWILKIWGVTPVKKWYILHKYSNKWTKINVDIGICLSNNQGNFQLHRFTRRENIAKSFRGGLLFLTHTVGPYSSGLYHNWSLLTHHFFWMTTSYNIFFTSSICSVSVGNSRLLCAYSHRLIHIYSRCRTCCSCRIKSCKLTTANGGTFTSSSSSLGSQ